MSSLDIAEKRLPQDGRIRLLLGGQRHRYQGLGNPDVAWREGGVKAA